MIRHTHIEKKNINKNINDDNDAVDVDDNGGGDGGCTGRLNSSVHGARPTVCLTS